LIKAAALRLRLRIDRLLRVIDNENVAAQPSERARYRRRFAEAAPRGDYFVANVLQKA
jgi:hypothetical protein